MSIHYDTMQVCTKSGHLITDRYHSSPGSRMKYCNICGSNITIQCGKCNTEIKGYMHASNVIDLTETETPVPLCCENCGEPYPWRNILAIKKFFRQCLSPGKYVIDSIVSIFKK